MRTVAHFLSRIGTTAFVFCFILASQATTAFAQMSPGQHAWLLNFAKKKQQEWARERVALQALSKRLGMPMRVESPEGQVVEIQELRDAMPWYYITTNLNAAKTLSTDKLWPGAGNGFALDGSGDTLAVWDGGAVRGTHQELAGRVTQVDGATALSGHSTHVAGTLIATGLYSAAKGMSFAASRLLAHDWNTDEAEMATAAAAGLQISNHSYGFISGWYHSGSQWYWYGTLSVNAVEDYKFGYYDSQCQEWDQIAWNAPNYLIAKSAGNDRNDAGPGAGGTHQHWDSSTGQWVTATDTHEPDGGTDGYDTIGGGAGSAKNTITVGAVYDIPGGYTQPADVVMSSFSGWGPTDDGRIKPDVVANGIGLVSAYSGADNQYASMSGTSMATPNLAGSVGLLLELQRNMHGNQRLLSSTIKGLVIHTADEAGPADGPDYMFGWGLVNTYRAAQVMRADSAAGGNLHIFEFTLANGSSIERYISSDGTQPLAATICWTDVPATPEPPTLNSPTARLVNDLDLRLQQGQITYMPWILDPANPANAATTGDNSRDNVEKVKIASPAAGLYTLRISHKGSLSGGSQKVSLVVTGNQQVIVARIKAFLQGPYNATTHQMDTALSDNSLLPLAQPFNQAPWNYGDTESVSGIPANVVDWVLLELRTGTDPGSMVARRAAFLRNDGLVVDLDGTTPVSFPGLASGNYYLVLYHRNHLAIMSANAVALSASGALYDFSSAQVQAYGIAPMAEVEPGVFAMRAGDGNKDGGIDALDRNNEWRPQNGTTWTYQKLGDFNLDGGIDAIDRNLYWRPNNGTATQVP